MPRLKKSSPFFTSNDSPGYLLKMPPDLKKMVEKIAEKRGMYTSEVIRMELIQMVRRYSELLDL